MIRALSSRWIFLVGVALLAAALGDACVESIANTGFVGAGFHDDDHVSVVPTVAGAFVLFTQFAVARCIALLRPRPAGTHGGWFAGTVKAFARRSPLRDLPYVFLMQFGALFAMESSEQLMLGGRFLGGMAWLGGPSAFSIGVHLGIGALLTVLLARFMRAFVATLAEIVSRTIDAIVLPRATGCAFAGRRPAAFPARAQAPHARQSGGRAPPTTSTLAFF